MFQASGNSFIHVRKMQAGLKDEEKRKLIGGSVSVTYTEDF